MFSFENETDLHGDERAFEANFHMIIWFRSMTLHGFRHTKAMGYSKMSEIPYFLLLTED